MGAACFTAWADGYTRGEMVTNTNTLVSGHKYIVFCSNYETPAKSGYWTTNSTGTNLIMAQHADDTEFGDAFVWTIEKVDGSSWRFINDATNTKILETASVSEYNAVKLGTSTAAEFNIQNGSGVTDAWWFNHYPSSPYTSTRTDLYTTDNNYGVSSEEGVALSYLTTRIVTNNRCWMKIYEATLPITNPLQVKLNELIKKIVDDNNPNEMQEALTRARTVQDATLKDVEDLLASYLIYKEENKATLQKPEATEPDAYGSVYMPFSMVVPEGVSAYAAVAEGEELKLTKVGVSGSTIPAGAYILWSSSVSGEVTMAKAATEAPDLQVTNELTGTIVDDIALPEGSNYVLSKGTQGIGFYKYTPTTYPAKRAVYCAGSSASTRFVFSFDDEPTAVPLLPATAASSSATNDLQGRQQSAPRAGFNIINGRKNIIR